MLHFDIDSFTVIFYHLIVYKSTYVRMLIHYLWIVYTFCWKWLSTVISQFRNKQGVHMLLPTVDWQNCYLHSEMFSWLQFYIFFIVSVWLGTVMTAYSWSYNSWESDRPVSRLNSVSAQSTEALDWAETSECYPWWNVWITYQFYI